MISAYTQMESPMEAFVMFRSALRDEKQPNLITFVSVIPSCANLSSLLFCESIHALAIKQGLSNQVSVMTALLSMYSKLGDINSASYIFHKMLTRTRLSWNSMISGYVYNGLWELSLDAFSQMQFAGFDPDEVSIVSILSACSKLEAILLGKSVHAFCLRKGFESSLNVSNSLLGFYSGCHKISSSLNLFNQMPFRNTISWNTLISVCIHNQETETAANVLSQMQKERLELDPVTLISILPSFSEKKDLGRGMAIHCYAVKTGFSQDVSLVNSLISMYCNCGELDTAKLLFESMPEKSLVSWNAMMTGFRQHSLHKEIMVSFGEMTRDGKRPNHITLLNLLPACFSRLQGKSVHGFAVRRGIIKETTIVTSLIIMYARFNDLRLCHSLFQMGEKEDISLWNAIMSAHVQTQNTKKAIKFFFYLLKSGLEPDNLTILSLISACVHLNSLKLANSITAYTICKGFNKVVTITNALIDLYARSGNISMARKLFNRLEGKDDVSWSVMINGYGLNGDGKSALDLFTKMEFSGIKPNGVTYSTILSACSHSGLAKEGCRVFNSMAQHGVSPRAEHYACLVDLLARTGNLTEAYEIVEGLPFRPSTSTLEAVLGGCSIHGNVLVAEKICTKLSEWDPQNSTPYVLLHNIYAANGRVVKQVWERVGIGTSLAAAGTTFLDWCILIFKTLTAEKQCLVAALCWAVWGARNDVVWQGKPINISAIVAFARSYLDQWQNAQKTQIESSWSDLQDYDGTERWIKPQNNSIKINVDAAIFEGQNRFGGAIVIRDHNGFLIEGHTKLHQGNIAPSVAEALSFREALSWIKDHQSYPVWVEIDCLLVIQALRSSTSLTSYFGCVIQECKAMLANLSNVYFYFVKRSANRVAHEFARASLFYPDCTFSMGNIPTELLPILVTEFEG
uniref:RNase H type-1 domain-containing protein n=1 Tax=Cannabis sativa TaxID=3483 RepID=A0A803PGU3_CANSA